MSMKMAHMSLEPTAEFGGLDFVSVVGADSVHLVSECGSRFEEVHAAIRFDSFGMIEVVGEADGVEGVEAEFALVGEVVDRENARNVLPFVASQGAKDGGEEASMPVVAVDDIGHPTGFFTGFERSLCKVEVVVAVERIDIGACYGATEVNLASNRPDCEVFKFRFV